MDILKKIKETAEKAVSFEFDWRKCYDSYWQDEQDAWPHGQEDIDIEDYDPIEAKVNEEEKYQEGYIAAMQEILKMINNDPDFQRIAEIEEKGYIYDPEGGCEYCHTRPNHSVRCRGCMCGNHE